METLGSLLGVGRQRVSEFVQIARLPEQARKEIRQRKIAGSTAVEADRIGGEGKVKTAGAKRMKQRARKGIGKALPTAFRTFYQRISPGFAGFFCTSRLSPSSRTNR